MRFAAAAASIVLTLVGCSQGTQRASVVSALATSIVEDQTFAELDIDRSEADCVADAVVEALGADRLRDLGLTADDGASDPGGTASATTLDVTALSDPEIAVLGTAMDTCVDGVRVAVVDSVAATIAAEPDPAFPVTEAQARCVAESVAAQVGLGDLVVLGARRDRSGGGADVDLSAGQSAAFADAFLDCVDVRQLLLDAIAAGGVDGATLDCISSAISDDDLRTVFGAAFRSEDDAPSAEELLAPAVQDCR